MSLQVTLTFSFEKVFDFFFQFNLNAIIMKFIKISMTSKVMKFHVGPV